MRKIPVDRIGSVTLNCRLARELRLAPEIPAVEGGVIAVRVLTSKSTCNQLELPAGRMSRVKAGDVVVGALGHRKAPSGCAGYLPESVKPGDTVHLLHLGDVIGICDGVNPDPGKPFECEVLGQALHFPFLGERAGVPAHIAQGALALWERLEVDGIPVVAVVGSCTNAGRTQAACSPLQAFAHRGLKVATWGACGWSSVKLARPRSTRGPTRTGCFTTARSWHRESSSRDSFLRLRAARAAARDRGDPVAVGAGGAARRMAPGVVRGTRRRGRAVRRQPRRALRYGAVLRSQHPSRRRRGLRRLVAGGARPRGGAEGAARDGADRGRQRLPRRARPCARRSERGPGRGDLHPIRKPLFRAFDSVSAAARVRGHALPQVAWNEDRLAASIDPSLFDAERACRLVLEEGIPFREAYRRGGGGSPPTPMAAPQRLHCSDSPGVRPA